MDIIQLLDREINRLETEKVKILHPLRQIFWECTLRCNMSCRHCGSDCLREAETPDMPLADFLKVLDEVAMRYDPSEILVPMVGGEPLVRADLDECGAEVAARGFSWGIVTNALLLDKTRLDRLIDAGMSTISIDIDGMQERHTWLRRNPHSWQRAVDAARLLADTDLIWDVITCATPRTFDDLPRLRDKLVEVGAPGWRIFVIAPMGRAADDADLVLGDADMRRLMDFIVETRRDGRINLSAACDGWLGDYEGKVRDYHYRCESGLTVASVRANGDICGCLSVRSDYAQGNIYCDSFCDVWEQQFDCMRDRSWMRRGECAGCDVFDYCQGNGMHLRRSDGSLMQCHYHRLFPDTKTFQDISQDICPQDNLQNK